MDWVTGGALMLGLLLLRVPVTGAANWLSGSRVYGISMGSGPPLWRRTGPGVMVTVRLLPYGGRVRALVPREPGFTHMALAKGGVELGTLLAAGAVLAVTQEGAVRVALLAFVGVEVAVALLLTPGRNLLRLLLQVLRHGAASPAGPEETGLRRSRAAMEALNHGELGPARELPDDQETAEPALLRLDAYVHGLFAEAGRPYENALAQAGESPADAERRSYLRDCRVQAARYALCAAEAGQRPVAEARQLADTAQQELPPALMLDAVRELDRITAHSLALGGNPRAAVRAARRRVRAADTRLDLADAYCTLALALDRAGDRQASERALLEAQHVLPWFARIRSLRGRRDRAPRTAPAPHPQAPPDTAPQPPPGG
ncbi:hypothetical protein AB0M28_01330 [Streptomyces sp. NPDC051940]|uniref:hypothetical protein n=1 Tax=Streptomyces sp. NPDC051940 TaxID=3155675 RepID=UPI003437DC48